MTLVSSKDKVHLLGVKDNNSFPLLNHVASFIFDDAIGICL